MGALNRHPFTCADAKGVFEKILTGEASDQAASAFSGHLEGCEGCSRRYQSRITMNQKLESIFRQSNTLFSDPPPLPLPELATPDRLQKAASHALVDFMMLLIASFSVLFFLFLLVVSYRSISRQYQAIRIFQATQETLQASRAGRRMMIQMPDLKAHEVMDKLAAMQQKSDATAMPRFAEKDPWGSPYVGEMADGLFRMRSWGPDRKDQQGQGDDISGCCGKDPS